MNASERSPRQTTFTPLLGRHPIDARVETTRESDRTRIKKGTAGSCSGRNTVGMRVLVARFFRHMISENVQVFWAALQRGEFITDAAEVVGRIASRARGG